MTPEDQKELKRRLALEGLKLEHRAVVQRIERGLATADDAAHVKLLMNHLIILNEKFEEIYDKVKKYEQQ
jgi:hypothetical protein